MRYCALVLAIVVIGSLATFSLRKDKRMATNPQPQELTTVLRPVPAILNEATHPPVAAKETQIKGKRGTRFEFHKAQFVSENHGWAMSSYALYRTTDGGKVWEQLREAPEKDARFASFCFVDELHGWLVVLKQDYRERYGVGNSSVIMVTNDGGKSWNLQASFPDEIVIRDIRFSNENEGLAVGAKGLDKRPDRSELFIVGTSDGGKKWNDISIPAKTVIESEYGIANDSGRYLQQTPSSVLLLTQGGRVMSTTDHGETWRAIAKFKDERPTGFVSSTSYQKVVVDAKQRMRVVAAAMGDEGYWGDFVVNDDGSWTSYELKLTPILDAVFLSENEVLSCGLSVRSGADKSKNRSNAGVVLRSFDSGKSWQTVYRSTSAETFFYIARIKDNDFYAVSDVGTFLRFTLPQ